MSSVFVHIEKLSTCHQIPEEANGSKFIVFNDGTSSASLPLDLVIQLSAKHVELESMEINTSSALMMGIILGSRVKDNGGDMIVITDNDKPESLKLPEYNINVREYPSIEQAFSGEDMEDSTTTLQVEDGSTDKKEEPQKPLSHADIIERAFLKQEAAREAEDANKDVEVEKEPEQLSLDIMFPLRKIPPQKKNVPTDEARVSEYKKSMPEPEEKEAPEEEAAQTKASRAHVLSARKPKKQSAGKRSYKRVATDISNDTPVFFGIESAMNEALTSVQLKNHGYVSVTSPFGIPDIFKEFLDKVDIDDVIFEADRNINDIYVNLYNAFILANDKNNMQNNLRMTILDKDLADALFKKIAPVYEELLEAMLEEESA